MNDYGLGNQFIEVVHGKAGKDFLVNELHLFCVKMLEPNGVFQFTERGFNPPAHGILRKGTVGEVYNVGGHNEMRNIDIVRLICRKLGKPESLITFVADRKGHDMRYAIDPGKIHRELARLPETKFADGLDRTIDWYLTHREWWETIISGEYQNYYEKMYGKR